MQKITFVLRKSRKTVANRAAHFDYNMHQIVCRLGICPRPTKGADSSPPDLLAIYRGPSSKEMGENGENRTGVEGRGKESWGEKGRREDGK